MVQNGHGTAVRIRDSHDVQADGGLREYWVLILPPEAHTIAVQIERQFYWGAANDDFHIAMAPILGPCMLVAIVLAHKRRMSSKALRKLLRRHKRIAREHTHLGEQDILIPGFDDDDKLQELAAAFYVWMENINPECN
jgi:hypothetical protein